MDKTKKQTVAIECEDGTMAVFIGPYQLAEGAKIRRVHVTAPEPLAAGEHWDLQPPEREKSDAR